MDFLVYYRAWPHKNLRCIRTVADDQKSACRAVHDMLVEEKEKFLKPLIAMIIGGKV
jgi:hypothetical protein